MQIDITAVSFKKTKKMESLLEKIKTYVSTMKVVGKTPASIDMTKKDYGSFLDKAQKALPPPIQKYGVNLVVGGIPVNQVEQ